MESVEQLKGLVEDSTECQICSNVFVNPRKLPCSHTFCLNCIEQWCKDKTEGDTVACPMCHAEFIVPTGGLSKLVCSVEETKVAPSALDMTGDGVCDICPEEGGMSVQSSLSMGVSEVEKCEECLAGEKRKIAATSFCAECQEITCEGCSQPHKSMKVMTHQLALTGEGFLAGLEQLICDKHPDEEIQFYCNDCKVSFCSTCLIPQHNEHNWSEIDRKEVEFKKRVKEYSDDVNNIKTSVTNLLEKIGKQVEMFKNSVCTTEKEILERSREIKEMVDRNTQDLIESLHSREEPLLRYIQQPRDELQHKMKKCETFIENCREIVEKNDSAIFEQISNELETRVGELKAEPLPKLSEIIPHLSLLPSNLDTKTNRDNLVGKMYVSLPSTKIIRAFTCSNKRLYMVFERSPDIDVYDADTFTFQRKITVPKLSDPCDIVSRGDVLHVSECSSEMIHRIKLPDGIISSWPVESRDLKMSISWNGNVVVACRTLGSIVEFSSEGRFLRGIDVGEIKGQRISLRHAVHLDRDRYLFCHESYYYPCPVCIVDRNGDVLEAYDQDNESDLRYPIYLAVGPDGIILALENRRHRIIQLNSSLKYVKEFIPPSVVWQPTRMQFCENSKRLYILGSQRINDPAIGEVGVEQRCITILCL